MARRFTKYPSNYVKSSSGWLSVPIDKKAGMNPTIHYGYEKDLGGGYFATVYPEHNKNRKLDTWVATIYKDNHVDSFKVFSTPQSAKSYIDEYRIDGEF